MNNFDLIEQIHLRLPLWDKAHSDKTDINTREELWDEVAHVVGCNKEVLKSRWKNLRDSYRKIIRKADGRETDPKWPYYNAMEFMREITMNARPKVMDITSNPTMPIIKPDYSLTIVRQQESDDSIDPLNDANGIKQEKCAKRQAADDLVTQFLEIESDKSQTDVNRRHHLFDDDDYQFLLSLHPHLKQVSLNRKLPLRMKIEQLIYDELFSTQPNNNCSY